jgi:hypothetical protein
LNIEIISTREAEHRNRASASDYTRLTELTHVLVPSPLVAHCHTKKLADTVAGKASAEFYVSQTRFG